jgi:Tol biopolymer transport system component
MPKRRITATVSSLAILVTAVCLFTCRFLAAQPTNTNYLGQTPPGKTPELFGPDLISTEANELNCAVSPQGNEIVFSVWVEGQNTLYHITRASDGTWGSREPLWFSGAYSDVDPCFSPGGDTLFFSSKRPLDGDGDAKDSDIWFSVRQSEGKWGEPVVVTGINTDGADDYYTSVTSDDDLYFSLFETHSSGDLYFASKTADGYGTPVLLADPISTTASEHDPFIAPDASYLIFTSDRPGGHGRGDLYITFRQEAGTWGEPLNMGGEINTDAYEYCAMLSPEGKYLFFTRNKGGNGNIYWMDAVVIGDMRDRE